jgi:hypothetical protein
MKFRSATCLLSAVGPASIRKVGGLMGTGRTTNGISAFSAATLLVDALSGSDFSFVDGCRFWANAAQLRDTTAHNSKHFID